MLSFAKELEILGKEAPPLTFTAIPSLESFAVISCSQRIPERTGKEKESHSQSFFLMLRVGRRKRAASPIAYSQTAWNSKHWVFFLATNVWDCCCLSACQSSLWGGVGGRGNLAAGVQGSFKKQQGGLGVCKPILMSLLLICVICCNLHPLTPPGMLLGAQS